MPDHIDRSYTPQQVAEILAVSAETVNRWAEEGKLTGFKTPGGRWRFRESELEALLDGQAAS
jgi:excisionase family DNA binding protein